jgi:hypothetical protein
VINLVSYYKSDEMGRTKEFEYHVGAVIAGVALEGDVVKIAE